MYHHCLYKTDTNSEYVNSTDYMLALEKISKEYIRKFQDRSYVLCSDIIYSKSQFQKFESAYHEVCIKLDEVKLDK